MFHADSLISNAFCFSEPCTSLGLWRGLIVAAFGDGHLRVFDMENGRMYVEVAAHARWINAVDVAKNGLVSVLIVIFFYYIWQIAFSTNFNRLLNRHKKLKDRM